MTGALPLDALISNPEREATRLWWDREATLPRFVRRAPDTLDVATGAWGRVLAEACAMPTAHTTAAAHTALLTLKALREVTGKTDEVRGLNAAIDLAIIAAEKLLAEREVRPTEATR